MIIQIVSYRVWDMRESSLNTGISSKNILSTSLLFKKMGGGQILIKIFMSFYGKLIGHFDRTDNTIKIS